MLKKLAFILALVIPTVASADRVYDVKATRPVERDSGWHPTCDATKRMLKDKHRIKINDDGSVTINGFKWRTLSGEPDLLIDFHAGKSQKTFLMMSLYVNQEGLSGMYILSGVQPDPEDPRKQYVCTDAVYLDGTRR